MPTVILRPNGAGDLTELNSQYPTSGYHWDKVDEESPDDDATYVANTTGVSGYKTDLYNLTDVSLSGTITNVRVQVRVYAPGNLFRTAIKTEGTIYYGGENGGIAAYIEAYTDYSVNPKTGAAWTWTQINSLQAGVSIDYGGRCTQVYVIVTYVSPPTVTTQAATNVEETTATGNGNITATGNGNCDQRGVEWGTSSGVYTNESVESGTFGTGAFTRPITGLSQGTRYYYRAKAHSAGGWGYGSEQQFLTKPEAPTGLTVTDRSANYITLSWTKGIGASRTMVRRKTGSYPTSRTDGTLVYFGYDTTATDSGLDPNTTYYYRAWSEVTVDSLQQYSDGYAQVTGTTSLYKSEGYIGDVVDCSADVKSYDRLQWEQVIPTPNESIMFMIRSSNDGVSWSDWQYVYSSPCTSFAIPVRRYLEWRAKLTSSDGKHTPKLSKLDIYWSKYV